MPMGFSDILEKYTKMHLAFFSKAMEMSSLLGEDFLDSVEK